MRSNHLRAALALSALLLSACGQEAPPAPPAAASVTPVAVASSAEPAPSASAPASPLESASASPSASAPSASASAAVRKPPPPSIAENPPSEEKTPAPSKAEWATAPEVSLARHTNPSCSAKRLREWVQIFCQSSSAGFSMIAGERAGVSYSSIADWQNGGGWLVFPVRRGDARMVQLHAQSKWGWVASVVVSEQWLPGDKGPLITVVDV